MSWLLDSRLRQCHAMVTTVHASWDASEERLHTLIKLSLQRRLFLSKQYMVEKIPRQGRLEGCHRMSAATHLIYRSESV